MSHHEHHDTKHHILPLWIYLAVGSALLVLTGVTIAAAYIDFNTMTGFSSMNFVIAMVIATIKATLVALIFMHLLFDKKFYLFTLMAGVGCLLIFIVFTLADTQYRGHVSPIEARPIVPQVTSDKFIGKPAEHETPSEQPATH
jgi:cytochrome c oxidase subunit 4